MHPKALVRLLLTFIRTLGTSSFLTHGIDLHVGRGSKFWAPVEIRIGNGVYIGKNNHIEANCTIGNFCLFANDVAIVGRHDHDFRAVGIPVRYSPWIASRRFPSKYLNEAATIGDDVWLGYGVIVLTGTKIGRGAIIAAGSLVSRDLPEYCIAAGSPARVVGQRFNDLEDIRIHEYSVKNGNFRLSEKSYDDCTIEPKSLHESNE